MSEWRQAQAAPKNGTRILGYDLSTGDIQICDWSYWMFGHPAPDGRWNFNDESGESFNLTHWMPLPELPK